MNQVQLGKLISEANPQRDAIHVAINPVIAAEDVYPAERVMLAGKDEETGLYFVKKSKAGVGIIDPFLRKMVNRGECCYLCLDPGTIESLRHDWTHPAFEEKDHAQNAEKAKSVRWIEEMASSLGMSCKRLMDASAEYLRNGEYEHMGDNEDYKIAFWGHEEEFWERYEIVTGVKVEDKSATFFTCGY